MAEGQSFLYAPRSRARIVAWLGRRLWQPTCLFLPAFGLGLLALAWTGAVRGTDDLPAVFYYDFRGHPLPIELTWFNAEEGKFFRPDPEGLRIALPKTWIHPSGGVGFWTSFGFGGDFEVTTTAEVLHADTPPAGFGVGLSFYVAKETGGGATIARLVRANGNQLLLCNRAVEVPGQNLRWPEEKFPCTDTLLRLRLKRTGTTLHYLWAPGAAGEHFEEIDQCEFGDSPIQRIRLTAVTGRQPCDVDVRLIDLRVRSQTSDLAAASPPVPTGAPPKSWWPVPLVIGLMLLLSVVACLLVVRRSRRARAEPVRGAAPEEQG